MLKINFPLSQNKMKGHLYAYRYRHQELTLRQFSKIELTKPSTVGLNSRVGQVLGLKLILQDLPFTIPHGSGIVHIKTSHSGGATRVRRTLAVIASIRIKRVLWLSGHIHLSLLLLRHLHSPIQREFYQKIKIRI